jgi:hypothetical protein
VYGLAGLLTVGDKLAAGARTVTDTVRRRAAGGAGHEEEAAAEPAPGVVTG